MPSLFSNEHSRGPLYQSWKARSNAQAEQRLQRVAEAQGRLKSPTPTGLHGPSHGMTYLEGLEIERMGLPGYVDPMNEGDEVLHGIQGVGFYGFGRGEKGEEGVSGEGRRRGSSAGEEELPSYHEAIGADAGGDVQAMGRRFTTGEVQTSAVARDRAASIDATTGPVERQISASSAEGVTSLPKPERRGSKVGSFFASAFTGYVPDKTQSGYRW